MRSRSLGERVERHVPLERDAADDPVAELEVAGNDPVRAVGTDDDVRADAVAAHARGHAMVVGLELGDGRLLAQLRPGGRRLAGQESVQAPPLRHADQRLVVAPREA